jgi:hypothetical protein
LFTFGISRWTRIEGIEGIEVFVLMASGGLNGTHLVLQFDVLHSRKPWGLNVKQGSTFTNL